MQTNILLYILQKIENNNSASILIETSIFIIFIIVALKTVSIIQAIIWIHQHGEKFTSEIFKYLLYNKKKTTDQLYWTLLRKTKGAWFPFGVKSFLIKELAYNLHKKGTPFWRSTARALTCCYYLFQFHWLAFIFGILLASYATLFALYQANSFPELLTIYIIVILLQACSISLSIEAVYCYVVLDSYAIFNIPNFPTNLLSNKEIRLTDLKTIVGKIFIGVFCGAIATYVAHLMANAFKGESLSQNSPTSIIEALSTFLQFFYFTTTTFVTVGFGDIVPVNGYGQFVVFLIEMQAFCIIAIVLASLFGSGNKSETVYPKKLKYLSRRKRGHSHKNPH